MIWWFALFLCSTGVLVAVGLVIAMLMEIADEMETPPRDDDE